MSELSQNDLSHFDLIQLDLSHRKTGPKKAFRWDPFIRIALLWDPSIRIALLFCPVGTTILGKLVLGPIFSLKI